jgi:MmyB-like transcription regulator ligand binding domain/Helix-turn-helix domain
VDARSEIREFLTTRRARITPDRAGLRTFGGTRRVPGLRREEVAYLAGVSVDYYTRLERGNAGGVSESVLDALARALQLDDVERAHLFDLARAAQPAPTRRRRAPSPPVRPSVARILDAMSGAPAFVRNGHMDLVAANRLGHAFYSQHFDSPHGPPNSARFIFLDARAPEFYVDWEQVATDAVGVLRSEAGRDPYDRELSDLVGQLSTRSETFRTRWAAHDVHVHDTGRKRFRHPVVGELELTYETMHLAADEGLLLFAYTAEPGTRSDEALKLLASWAATIDEEEARHGDHAELGRDRSRAD